MPTHLLEARDDDVHVVDAQPEGEVRYDLGEGRVRVPEPHADAEPGIGRKPFVWKSEVGSEAGRGGALFVGRKTRGNKREVKGESLACLTLGQPKEREETEIDLAAEAPVWNALL